MPATVERRRGRRPKNERHIYQSRTEVLKALEETGSEGIPFFVRWPNGDLRYIIAGSNAAAAYEVFRHMGGSVRACKTEPGDPQEALEAILVLPEEQRRKLLADLQKSLEQA